MANALAITLHASAAETIAGQGAAVDISALRGALKLALEITVVVGTTPALTLIVETSPSGTTSWQQVAAFAAQSAVGAVDLVLAGCKRFVRVRWTITGGTPSFTFVLAGEAHQLYATIAEAEGLAIPAPALASLSAEDKAKAILRASDEAHGSLESAYTPPITAWGDDVRGACADLYLWHALGKRGFNPESADLVMKRRDDATSWLTKIANGQKKAAGLVDSTPTIYEASAYVVTQPKRGW